MPLQAITKWDTFTTPELVMVELPFEKIVSILFIEIVALPDPAISKELPATAVATVIPEVLITELDDPGEIIAFIFPLTTIFLKLPRGTGGFVQDEKVPAKERNKSTPFIFIL